MANASIAAVIVSFFMSVSPLLFCCYIIRIPGSCGEVMVMVGEICGY